MLEPGIIPEEEPDIRVGIILPEDGQKSINIELSNSDEYLLVDPDHELTKLHPGDTIEFSQNNKLIEAKIESNIQKSEEWKIIPVNADYKMKNEAGVCVKDVISGRSFHWEKHIDVFIPGKIEISIHGNNLMVVNELPLEQYLMCVATSEMSSTCPGALIESQTICARSWMLANVEQ